MANETTKKFTVYSDDEQWVPFFKWFWIENPPKYTIDNVMGHGAYPAKWIAWLLGWWHTK